MDRDELFMREAVKEAEKAVKKRNHGVGCVIVFNDKIISRAYSKKYPGGNRFLHAEINAIVKVEKTISRNPNKVDIYTTFEPCPMCFSTIVVGKFKRLVYGMSDKPSGATHLHKHMPSNYKQSDFQLKIKGPFLEQECREVFEKSVENHKKISPFGL